MPVGDVGLIVKEALRTVISEPGLGKSFVYKRFKQQAAYDKTTGTYVPSYWEQPTLSGLVIFATVRDVAASKGLLQEDDRGFVFATSAFTSQGITDTNLVPAATDEVVYGGQTFKVDLGDGATLISTDATERIWTVWGRRRR